MKLGQKFKEQLEKPRRGWLFRTSNFILYDPFAFKLVFQWGLWFCVVFFAFFSYVFWLVKADIVLTILFSVFFVINVVNLIKFYRDRKVFDGLNMNIHDFMQYKRKKIKTEKVK